MKKLVLFGMVLLAVAVIVVSQQEPGFSDTSVGRLVKQNFLITASICDGQPSSDCYIADNAYFATSEYFGNETDGANETEGDAHMYFIFGSGMIKPEVERVYTLIGDGVYWIPNITNVTYYINGVVCAHIDKERSETWKNRIVEFNEDCLEAIELGLNKYKIERYWYFGDPVYPPTAMASAPIITGTEWAIG